MSQQLSYLVRTESESVSGEQTDWWTSDICAFDC
jgi:hypothetical protein